MAENGYEWGPLVLHDGKGCPCHGEWVEVHGVLPDQTRVKAEGFADRKHGDWLWANFGKIGVYDDGKTGRAGKIIAYRIRRRNLHKMFHIKIDADQPAPVPEGVE
ncbi:MAG: hypothetical protein AAGK66_07275 [Pseudomonadota bacterium]